MPAVTVETDPVTHPGGLVDGKVAGRIGLGVINRDDNREANDPHRAEMIDATEVVDATPNPSPLRPVSRSIFSRQSRLARGPRPPHR